MEVGANKPDKRPSFLNPFATESTNSLAVDLASSTQLACGGGGNDNAGFLVPAVGNNTAATAMSETTKALYRATQSMFSLRANKSMRLQRFGAWIAYHDTQSASVFWYNHETAEGQWEEPAQVAALKQQQASNTKKDIFDKVGCATASDFCVRRIDQ